MKALICLILLFHTYVSFLQAQSPISIQGHGNVLTNGHSNTVSSNVHITDAYNTFSQNYNNTQAAQDLKRENYNKVFFIDKKKEESKEILSSRIEARAKKKVLILTATNFETEIFHQTAKELGLKVVKQMVNDQVIYSIGTLGGVEVFHMQPHMMGMLEPGSTPLILMSVFKDINPTYIITTGIAFGNKSKGQAFGDILISRQLANYESRKESNGDIYFRGDKVTSPMLGRVNAGIHSWKGAKIHQGLVLSGNVLVNSKEFLNHLSKREPEYVGGDMESYGAYAVASMVGAQWIMIKGISDWGDGSKNDDSHKIALQNAIRFIFHLIKEGNLK